eukprot:1159049-Pelagomonas_calceolata.AAC.13
MRFIHCLAGTVYPLHQEKQEKGVNGDQEIATEVTVLWLRGLKLLLSPGAFTVFELHKMDVLLFWKKLARVTDLARSRRSGYGWRWVLPVPSAPPSTSILEQLAPVTLINLEQKKRSPLPLIGV